MQYNLLWESPEYHSLENCIITVGSKDIQVNSTILGYANGMIFNVAYRILVTTKWETQKVELDIRLGKDTRHMLLERSGKSHWLHNGQPSVELEGCTDVDISLTPFTNTLPVNRLKIQLGQSEEIKVLYIDILENIIKPAKQQYIKNATGLYHFQNVPNDFEAMLQADRNGFIKEYPGLFSRIAILEID